MPGLMLLGCSFKCRSHLPICCVDLNGVSNWGGGTLERFGGGAQIESESGEEAERNVLICGVV